MSRGHVQQRRCEAGLRVEERRRIFRGEGWDGVWGNVGTSLALEISQSWFGLLLVPFDLQALWRQRLLEQCLSQQVQLV